MEIVDTKLKGPESSEQNNQLFSSGKGSNKRQTPLFQGITCEPWGLLTPQTLILLALAIPLAPSPGVSVRGAAAPCQCPGELCRSSNRGGNPWL